MLRSRLKKTVHISRAIINHCTDTFINERPINKLLFIYYLKIYLKVTILVSLLMGKGRYGYGNQGVHLWV